MLKEALIANKLLGGSGGGGGSSDFATANITITNTLEDSAELWIVHIEDNFLLNYTDAPAGNTITIKTPIPVGGTAQYSGEYGGTTTGGISVSEGGDIEITGDGTWTITEYIG